jgi:hypothetical protein
VSGIPSRRKGTSGLLKTHISEQRLLPYMEATFSDEGKAVELYIWDRQLATAFFHDLSVLEVALRNAVDRALTKLYGLRTPIVQPGVIAHCGGCAGCRKTLPRTPPRDAA